jgi:hypothetical protein
LGAREVLSVPNQFNSVQVGHVVRVKLIGDPYMKGVASTKIHLVTSADKKALDIYFKDKEEQLQTYDDGKNQMIVSSSTSLGKVLIGRKKGDRGYYEGINDYDEKVNYRFEIIDAEDSINVTPLFYLES